ncbi:MAG TPA: hypothetical protein VFI82_12130 [Terriglobales bacterium]|nr:hypothetical protein [Terriglobales bacterium]
MDAWTILLAIWLPVAGIVVALCLYSMTERSAEEIPAQCARGESSSTETPSTE